MQHRVHLFGQMKSWLLPRDLSDDIRERSRSELLVSVILGYLALVISTMTVFFVFIESGSAAATSLRYGALVSFVSTFIAVLLIFRFSGRRLLCANLLSACIFIILMAVCLGTGGIRGPVPILFVFVPATAILLANRDSGLCWGGAIVVALLCLHGLEQQGHEIQNYVPDATLKRATTLILFLLFILVISTLLLYDYMADRLAAELQRERNRYAYLAEHDPLTKLPNRSAFSERLVEEIARTQRMKVPFALMYLDLDGFKPINDRLGHAVGDVVLQMIASRLAASTRANDFVARLGGDEFAILLEGVSHEAITSQLAQKILDEIATPFVLRGEELSVTASLGIVQHPECPGDAEELQHYADLAMYAAKQEHAAFRFHRMNSP